jgi:hypothetical protein
MAAMIPFHAHQMDATAVHVSIRTHALNLILHAGKQEEQIPASAKLLAEAAVLCAVLQIQTTAMMVSATAVSILRLNATTENHAQQMHA